MGSLRSFTLTILWNLASLARNYPGIIVLRHHADQKQMGLPERAVRRVKEGTSAVLLQSGLGNEWWAVSMKCYCYLRNIQDLLSDVKTPYERRFGMPFNKPVIPFGAMVEYHPISAKDRRDCISSGLYAGGIWKGDIMVADMKELEEMDASELHARRLNAKEVLTPQRSGNFILQGRRWTVKIFGGGQRLRTSTFTWDRPERGEERGVLHANSDERYSTHDDEEVKNDFWTITGEFSNRHHVVPRVKLYMPKEETYPIPTKFIDVTRTTHTSLDVLMEKQIEDYMKVDRERELSDARTGFTRFILVNERSPDGYTWSGRRYKKTNNLSPGQCMARYVDAYG